MNRDVVFVFAEDDVGHFLLAKKYLAGQGVRNEMIRFPDGRTTLDFFLMQGEGPTRDPNREYVLILDIRMPRIDGIEVLRAIRADSELKDLPIIILSTTDNPDEVKRCHALGCHAYIVKPVKYGSYIDAMRKVGLFPSLLRDGFVLQKQEPAKAEAD
jgi:CheY-like chemotaxis protein